MELIQKYLRGRRVKRKLLMPDFNNMESIFDNEGNLRNDIDLQGKTWDELINNATSRGYGSLNIGGQNYTLYKKLGNNIVIPEYDPNKNPNVNDPAEVARYNWLHRNDNTHTLLIYRPATIETPKVEESTKTQETAPSIEEYKPFYKLYGLTEDLFRNFSSTPDTGRLSQIRQHELLLTNPTEYFNNPDVIRNMNKYYGMGYALNNPDAENNVSLTLGFILNNANLTKDRMGKGMDYLPMESARLDRTIGGYKDQGLTYRLLLNYYNNDDNFNGETIGGGLYTNKTDFMEALYKLGASRNGMQTHELKRLFGDNYNYILRNIINSNKANLKQGGILNMLFI